MSEEKDYIPFALPLIRRFFTDKTTAADDIVNYGLYRFGMTIIDIADEKSIYRQLTYEFIRQGLQMPRRDEDQVTRSLSQRLVNLMDEEGYLEDLDYNGFTPESDFTEFDCADDISLLMAVAENDEQFRKDAEEWYRLYQTKEIFRIPLNAVDYEQLPKEYSRMIESIGEGNKIPVSCKIDMLLEMGDKPRSERERAKFCYYLGIRSLIGQRKIAQTNSNAIKLRMMGAKNQTELDEILKDKRLSSVYEKWGSDYQYRNLIRELREDLLINFATHYKYSYVSCSIRNKDKFANAISEFIASRDAKAAKQRWKELDMEYRKMINDKLAVIRGESTYQPTDEIDDG